MNRHEIRYLTYGIAAIVMLIFASIPIADDRLIWTASYPFIVLLGGLSLLVQFRKHYTKTRPSPAMNAIQLLYLLVLVYAAFLSIIVVLDLIR